MSNPHTYVGWVSNLSEISLYILIAQYRMKISIIANFYFDLMLPPAKVGICKDIFWRNGQSDQSNPMYNPHTYIGWVSKLSIFYYIRNSYLVNLMLYEVAPRLKVITPQRPPMGGTYVGKNQGGYY